MVISVENLRLTDQQIAILGILKKVYPNAITSDDLIDRLYADDPNGGPDSARLVVSVQLNRIRKRIAASGWTIPRCGGGKDNFARYRLVKNDGS